MLRAIVKVFFLAQAAVEVAREKIEDCLDVLTSRADEYRSSGHECLEGSKDKLKEQLNEVSGQVWQRSEILENHLKEKIKRQVADFSLGALGDSTEINELRAEMATSLADIP